MKPESEEKLTVYITTRQWSYDIFIRNERLFGILENECSDVRVVNLIVHDFTVVSDRLNVNKGLKRTYEIAVLEEVDIWLACRQ